MLDSKFILLPSDQNLLFQERSSRMHMFMALDSGFCKIMFILLEKPIAFYMRHVIIWVRVPDLQRPIQGLVSSFGGWGLLWTLLIQIYINFSKRALGDGTTRAGSGSKKGLGLGETSKIGQASGTRCLMEGFL